MKKIVLIAAVFLLAGCASGTVTLPAMGTNSGPLGDITKLAVTDLQVALADATAHQDQAAMACYPVLINIVQSLPSQVPTTAPAGVVSAFQAARDLSKSIQSQTAAGQGSIVQAVNLGCAALFNDVQGDVLRIGAKIRP
jgi:hypothetical protein